MSAPLNMEAQLYFESIAPDTAEIVRQRLERPFFLMCEAVEYRLERIVEEKIELFSLIPEAEYKSIRIYVSDVGKVRRLLRGEDLTLGYVSFIGEHRAGVMDEVEATDRALIRSSTADCPILGYFSLQDPQEAWINLVLFDDLDAIGRWVSSTRHADDWMRAASFFHRIDKSVGTLRYLEGRVELEPHKVIRRDYDAVG